MRQPRNVNRSPRVEATEERDSGSVARPSVARRLIVYVRSPVVMRTTRGMRAMVLRWSRSAGSCVPLRPCAPPRAACPARYVSYGGLYGGLVIELHIGPSHVMVSFT